MIVASFNDSVRQMSVLMVVIEPDNLARMGQADPITLESVQQGGSIMPLIQYPENVSFLIAYEEDKAKLYQLAASGDTAELLRWLERGRVFDPKTDGPDKIRVISKRKAE